MRRLAQELATSTALTRLRADTGGNVALIFGLLALPMLGIIGAAVDYGNAARERSHLQNALDSAALAGAKELHRSNADVERVVRDQLNANLPENLRNTPFTYTISNERRTLAVQASAQVSTNVLPLIGQSYLPIGGRAEATFGRVEVALAVDVTGSMRRWNQDLNAAARLFVETLIPANTTSDLVRIALVPYAAAVNVGPNQMAWMDTAGSARFHGVAFENIRIPDARCYVPPPPPPPPVAQVPPPPPPPAAPPPPRPPTPPTNPPPPPPPANPPPPPPPPRRPPPGNDLSQLVPSTLERVAQVIDRLAEAVGPSAARAQTWPYGAAPSESSPVDCNRRTPSVVNHFDLFRAMRVDWAGCVEARPAPFDTDMTQPSRGNPDTLFVPYLWPDERDRDNSVRNDYIRLNPQNDMPSWVGNQPGDNARNNQQLAMAWIWKYLNATPSLDNSSQTQRGPNGGCPPPIIPLTSNRSTLLSTIDSLRTYGQGGTIISEGVAWARRTLAERDFYANGRPFGQQGNRKVIVLMTDGANFVIEQNNTFRSDYGAYGYANQQRLGSNNIDRMREEIDRRTAAICAAAKAQDITVYTIMFDPMGTMGGTPTQLMQACATSPNSPHFVLATSGAGLRTAFQNIAADISNLRLRR